MKKRRRYKTMTILILFMAVVGLTMGFLAFSTTLVVESGVDVMPDEADFKLVLYGYDYSKSPNPEKFEELSTTVSDPFRIIGAKSANQAKIDNSLFSVSNLHAEFTGSGQSASYAFIVKNEGGCDAYLNEIRFNKIVNSAVKKQCVSTNGYTAEVIDKVCDNINLSVEVKGNEYFDTEQFDGNNIIIPKGEFIEFFIHIDYRQHNDRVDNELFVDFGNVLLGFSALES